MILDVVEHINNEPHIATELSKRFDNYFCEFLRGFINVDGESLATCAIIAHLASSVCILAVFRF